MPFVEYSVFPWQLKCHLDNRTHLHTCVHVSGLLPWGPLPIWGPPELLDSSLVSATGEAPLTERFLQLLTGSFYR